MNGDFPNRRGYRRGGKMFFLPLLILCLFVLSFVVRFLWNAILPEVLGAKPLNFWQAMGLLVLCKILFGNFGFRRGGEGGRRFKEKFQERFGNMSDEERNRLREEWKKRCRF